MGCIVSSKTAVLANRQAWHISSNPTYLATRTQSDIMIILLLSQFLVFQNTLQYVGGQVRSPGRSHHCRKDTACEGHIIELTSQHTTVPSQTAFDCKSQSSHNLLCFLTSQENQYGGWIR